MNHTERAALETKEVDDEMYADAVRLVRESGFVSIAYIQRKLILGYNRAARIVEAMEFDGVVSAPNTKGERTVLSA